MTTLSLDTKTMSPWHDINRMLSNAKSLKVTAGGQVHEGAAILKSTDGHLNLVFPDKPKKKAKKAKK